MKNCRKRNDVKKSDTKICPVLFELGPLLLVGAKFDGYQIIDVTWPQLALPFKIKPTSDRKTKCRTTTLRQNNVFINFTFMIQYLPYYMPNRTIT